MAKKNTFSTGYVAKLLGVTNKTIVKWIREKGLNAFQLPGGEHYRIRKEELIKFLKINNVPVPKEIAPRIGKPRILIIDDDENMCFAIKRILVNDGSFEVDVAFDGFDGGLKINTFKPDLVLLDIKMPGIDGIEVLKRIKENPDTLQIKVVIISAFINNDISQKIKELDGDGVIKKPFKKEELLKKIKSCWK
ncbi:MAG: response regulator [Candidatus Aureabacteria bacterium]|nr:response regulator [Candidatus Auribacterota bacterium]